MAPRKKKSRVPDGFSDQILQAVGRIIPTCHGFFKKMEKSPTFGPRMSEIRKEIDRRFGGAKK